MRREPWFGGGLLLAAVAELQWASVFYADVDLLHAAILFVAACGLFLAAGGVLLKQAAWTLQWGLVLAAAAHLLYLATTLDFGPLLIAAALAAAAGLSVAWWGARSGATNLARGGLFAASLGGALWLLADVLAGDMSFMVGNVFAMVGWGIAAGTVPAKLA